MDSPEARKKRVRSFAGSFDESNTGIDSDIYTDESSFSSQGYSEHHDSLDDEVANNFILQKIISCNKKNDISRVPNVSPAKKAKVSPAGLSPAGLSPAGLSPAGLSPAGLSPAGFSPTFSFKLNSKLFIARADYTDLYQFIDQESAFEELTCLNELPKDGWKAILSIMLDKKHYTCFEKFKNFDGFWNEVVSWINLMERNQSPFQIESHQSALNGPEVISLLILISNRPERLAVLSSRMQSELLVQSIYSKRLQDLQMLIDNDACIHKRIGFHKMNLIMAALASDFKSGALLLLRPWIFSRFNPSDLDVRGANMLHYAYRYKQFDAIIALERMAPQLKEQVCPYYGNATPSGMLTIEQKNEFLNYKLKRLKFNGMDNVELNYTAKSMSRLVVSHLYDRYLPSFSNVPPKKPNVKLDKHYKDEKFTLSGPAI